MIRRRSKPRRGRIVDQAFVERGIDIEESVAQYQIEQGAEKT